ncbi:MAG: hypothetical protein M1820_008383 [Bogoriella megaspora]|nr:MAG: hypothetical protein M1820_008383 [Bogoriella megaspora]
MEDYYSDSDIRASPGLTPVYVKSQPSFEDDWDDGSQKTNDLEAIQLSRAWPPFEAPWSARLEADATLLHHLSPNDPMPANWATSLSRCPDDEWASEEETDSETEQGGPDQDRWMQNRGSG